MTSRIAAGMGGRRPVWSGATSTVAATLALLALEVVVRGTFASAALTSCACNSSPEQFW